MGNKKSYLKTPPILVVAFNRPDQLFRVLQVVKEIKPESIYISIDGPRENNPKDIEKVRIVKDLINSIEFCKVVRTKISDVNLGSQKSVSQAVTWFLNEVGEGIILEDDCLPDPSFFKFCGEMLEKYRNCTNIMQISGFNLLSGKHLSKYDYYFSNFGWSWGWATWKRAWDKFDLEMRGWGLFKQLGFHNSFPFYPERIDTFNAIAGGKGKMWDFMWAYSIAINSGLSIVPTFSLIKNIGFTRDATHPVSSKRARLFDVPVKPITLPLNHPDFFYPDITYDKKLIKYVHKKTLIQNLQLIGSKLKKKFYPIRHP